MDNKNDSQNKNLIFGKITSFQNAFPEIEDLNVRVYETGRSVSPLQPAIFSKNYYREKIECSNLACINGGLHIGSIVRDMIMEKKENINVKDYNCKGSEKGINKKCWNFFSYEIDIKYLVE